ncbi:MAG: DUF4124 domain-containing protein [Candidatus Berkiella sp.]
MQNRYKRITLIFLLSTLSPLCFATSYKYQDSQGQTVYTQNPPLNTQVTEITPPPPPSSSAATEKAALDKRIEQDKENDTKKAEASKEAAMNAYTAEEKQENCMKARQQLTNLQLRGRIKMIGADGQATMLTETQKMAEIEKTKELIKAFCTQPSI